MSAAACRRPISGGETWQEKNKTSASQRATKLGNHLLLYRVGKQTRLAICVLASIPRKFEYSDEMQRVARVTITLAAKTLIGHVSPGTTEYFAPLAGFAARSPVGCSFAITKIAAINQTVYRYCTNNCWSNKGASLIYS
jgi:hypothetical protein